MSGATRVIGLAGWSGAGKTTLLIRLLPALKSRGITVSTIKHAHHSFDVDKPAKDSYRHRAAGAQEVLVSSANRFALMGEHGSDGEPCLATLLKRLAPCDLVLVEGFKREAHAKIEVYRSVNGKPFLHPGDTTIRAIASDVDVPGSRLPVMALDDIAAIASACLAHAAPLPDRTS